MFASVKAETSPHYKTRVRSLYQNLCSKTSSSLRANVLSNAISSATLMTMTHDELKTEEHKAEKAAMTKENMDKTMVAQEEQSISIHL
jgi:transcription elongation factor S-II